MGTQNGAGPWQLSLPLLSPLPLTHALAESWLGMALKGVFSPLVPKVQLQLLQPFGVVWGIFFFFSPTEKSSR